MRPASVGGGWHTAAMTAALGSRGLRRPPRVHPGTGGRGVLPRRRDRGRGGRGLRRHLAAARRAAGRGADAGRAGRSPPTSPSRRPGPRSPTATGSTPPSPSWTPTASSPGSTSAAAAPAAPTRSTTRSTRPTKAGQTVRGFTFFHIQDTEQCGRRRVAVPQLRLGGPGQGRRRRDRPRGGGGAARARAAPGLERPPRQPHRPAASPGSAAAKPPLCSSPTP